MTAPALLAGLVLAIALIASGAVGAFTTANALKKVGAIAVALGGALLALALLQAPNLALIALVAVSFAYAVVGVALAVRLQEAYGVIETDEIDAADEQDEPRGPRP